MLKPGKYTEEVEQYIKRIYVDGLRSPANFELDKLLSLAVQGSGPTYIFIDGLDESNKEVQGDIMSSLNYLLNTSSGLIKVFLSLREDTRILKQMKISYNIKLSEARLTGDIVSFVEDNIKTKITEGLLIFQDKNLENEIVKELITKSCGM